MLVDLPLFLEVNIGTMEPFGILETSVIGGVEHNLQVLGAGQHIYVLISSVSIKAQMKNLSENQYTV